MIRKGFVFETVINLPLILKVQVSYSVYNFIFSIVFLKPKPPDVKWQ